MKINEVLQTGREALSKNGIDPRETRLFLAFAMGIKHEELIKYRECSESQYNLFIELINRRVSGEPYAYIVGVKEFMKLNFKVSPDVLIPREDTEVLVQELIEIVPKSFNDLKKLSSFVNLEKNEKENLNIEEENSIKILDMCTGSGCIAISLAKYIKNAKITAADISEKALKIAKENAIINEVNVEFIQSDLFEKLSFNEIEEDNLKRLFDVIVSNPPYIRKSVIENLQKEVKREPIIALDGGVSGLEFYEKITSEALKYLNVNGILAFEIGFDQGESVSKIMQENGYRDIYVKKDIGGNDRVVIGRK